MNWEKGKCIKFNYFEICSDLLKNLPERPREIIQRHFGLEGRLKETLESIGNSFGITRERVRQLEVDAFLKLKSKTTALKNIFQYFKKELKSGGGLKKEEILLSRLGGENFKSEILFLLTLGEPFKRFAPTKEFYSLWTINPSSVDLARKIIKFLCQKLKEVNTPLSLKGLSSFLDNLLKLKEEVLGNYLEISKIIQKNQDGLYGLKDWPEINPRNIRDRAYLVFKKELKPLHFAQVSQLIGPDALPQTVHNELIRDPRFVLVGRGIYALKEWGYEEGNVRDIILKILKEAKNPLSKEEILEKVFQQRIVKPSTVLINLGNRNYFLKTSEGKYQVKEI